MPTERNWHSVNVITTLIAVAAVWFAALQWRTAERQRQDAKQIHEAEARVADERLKQVTADYQSALLKRDAAYATAVRELQSNNGALLARLQENERLVGVLSREIAARPNSAGVATPLPSSDAHEIPPRFRDAAAIIGKWKDSLSPTHTVEFFDDGTLVEVAVLKIFNGTYSLLDGKRMRWITPGLLWGVNDVVLDYSISGNDLRLETQNKIMKLHFTRVTR